jgi:predicted NUDIX family NTP pyrophosphohydrolase
VPEISAGVLLYRRRPALEVLLVHPGGPFWARRDEGAWSVPKGLCAPGEDPLAAARRELTEETGCVAAGPFLALTPLRQKSGKVVHAFAAEGDFDVATLVSDTFELEWPRGSGRVRTFPEVDRAAWFGVEEALARILPGQAGFVRELRERVGG